MSDDAYQEKTGHTLWPYADRFHLQLAVWHLVDDYIHAGYDCFYVVALPGLAYDFAEYAMRQRNAMLSPDYKGKALEVYGLIPEEYELSIDAAKLMGGFDNRYIVKGFFDPHAIYTELVGVVDDILVIDIDPEASLVAQLATAEGYRVIPCPVDSLVRKAKETLRGAP